MHRFRLPTLLALAVALIALGILSSGGAASAGGSSRTSVIIAFNQQPGPAAQALVRQAGGSIRYTYDLVPAIAASVPEAAIAGLQANPNVARVEPDLEIYVVDAELDNTWGVKRIGAGTVHDGGNKGAGVKVAVLDTGIDTDHPDLSYDPSCSTSFVPGEGLEDGNGHGTHTSGTIAALDNNIGVVGVAPEATICALKVLSNSGSGSYSNVIAALDFVVTQGDIFVTNNSYGSSGDPGLTVKAAFDNAYAAGVLHAAAAGNGGNPPGKGDNCIYPARWDSLIATAATKQGDSRASFSSTCAENELAAPGQQINSTVPGGGYGEKSGTSMASPHVAGTAALVLAANPGWSNDQVRAQLQSTAEDLGAAGRDTKFGYGLVNADAAATPAAPPAPDTTPPALVSATVDSTSLVLAYDEALDTGSVPATDRFIIGTDGDPQSVIVVGVSGTDVTLTLSPGVASGDTVTVSYTAGANPIQDTSGNDAADLVNEPLANNTAAAGGIVSVDSITYAAQGGKNQDKHLLITVVLDQAVSGASVSIDLFRDTSKVASGTGTTGTDGTVTFSLKNASSGCYTTDVTNVTAAGLTWNGATPANSFCK